LTEAEKILQWQKKRSSVTDSMLNQQAQELAASQEQIQSLFQQLETAVQTVQSQAMFIETHKSQLQISQERVAQLERECTLLQTKYGEQSQQLLHSENTCRELRSRLIRQQRQTLQFKAALEKCLDTSVPNYDTLDDTAHHPHDITSNNTRFSRKARSLFPNAQPIKPWSAEGDATSDSCSSFSHKVESWVEPAQPSTQTTDYSTFIAEPDENLADVDHSFQSRLEVDESTDGVADVPPVQKSHPEPNNLDRQLESLIEMFFSSQPTSSNPPSVNYGNTDTTERSIWESLPENGQGDERPQIIIEQPVTETNSLNDIYVSPPEDVTVSSSNESLSNAAATEKQTNTSDNQPHIHDYWSDLHTDDFNLQPLGEYSLDHKSPSPLIYPQRPPKGRKSFASVELPNFRPKVKGQGSNE
jgi:molecular chaperone GrpE (heat shock protein)